MHLTDAQKAMIYLVVHGLRHRDFSAFMGFSNARATQLLQTYPTTTKRRQLRWGKRVREKALEATNGGLDVTHTVWDKIEKLLAEANLSRPTITCDGLEAAKALLNDDENNAQKIK